MSSSTEAEFRLALGVRRPARFSVTAPGLSAVEHELSAPYAVIGRAAEAHWSLSDETVAYRHAYLQAIGDRLLCVDLFSPNGVQWDDGADQNWCSPGRVMRLGACRVALVTGAAGASS